jgi:hypothetical protein
MPMATEAIQEMDYVDYARNFKDGAAWGVEYGSGYVKIIDTDGVEALIVNGDREFWVPLSKCSIRAKQFRLEV